MTDSLQILVRFVDETHSSTADSGSRTPEGFSLSRPADSATESVCVVGTDERGLAYGVLELADVAAHAADPISSLNSVSAGWFAPKTKTRGILRTLSSDVQDLSWFHDREFWASYLTHLATHRINRFQLALGMQYNYSHDPNVEDNYLAFPYPFLVDVPGFEVRAEGVDEDERARNLESLRFIGREAHRRGIDFQLGLWNHAYAFPDSPQERYPIHGLTAETHASYCRAALRQLLTSCPHIDGITVRVHYEGGIHEPTHEFWGTVLAALSEVDRTIDLDMHSKGVDERILTAARHTGSPLTVSAKYWAEHWGLPYHQAAVRGLEKARPDRQDQSGVTRGSRRFTRYGFGDFLRQDRDYELIFRIWPGSQRVLLWGDPAQVSGIARATASVGAGGVELCEPLSFLGRKTTGKRGSRELYTDPALQTDGDPWTKYRYTYRLWGRLLYDPDQDPSGWRRSIDHYYGRAGRDMEDALSAASRILPLVTTYHGPSASNNFYWPEMYVNMPLANSGRSDHYAFDTPEPATLGAVSPFDPQLFDSIETYVANLLDGRRSGRYTPHDVATWLEHLSCTVDRHLSAAVATTFDEDNPEFRRSTVDIGVLARLGEFFAAKTRAGICYALYVQTSSTSDLTDAVTHYRRARDAYAAVANLTTDVYTPDLAFGDRRSERGHWSDRLDAVEHDLANLEEELAAAPATYRRGLQRSDRSDRPCPTITYDLPEAFESGTAVPIRVTTPDDLDCRIELNYRHLNQGEPWNTVTMAAQGHRHQAEIPGDYSESEYALQFYFTIHDPVGGAWIVPGFDSSLTNQPYVVLHQQR